MEPMKIVLVGMAVIMLGVSVGVGVLVNLTMGLVLVVLSAVMFLDVSIMDLSKKIDCLMMTSQQQLVPQPIQTPEPQKPQEVIVSQEENEALEAKRLAEEVIKKAEKKPEEKKEIEFYDLKAKEKFKTTDYKFVTRSNRNFAVAINPSGTESWKIVGKSKKAK